MALLRFPRGTAAEAEYALDHLVRNVRTGRFERSLSMLAGISALVTGAEVYFEHYRASFGDPWMWTPIALTPPYAVAGVAGAFSRRWAKTWLPITAGLYFANGVIGSYLHVRGIGRKPGGWKIASYNIPMGPPLMAPGLMTLVGGMGLLAAVLRREQ